ncbi:hypothetical protein AK812_SmicGene40390 [Symbiodinium microadriaticum]|uniref:Uncharacterized protein n=1 Tax=Symbiodinium microadriaticum TaxID=2951 RepID=A0A1Q9C8T4_SYMMI|nr:hypothetical protein AK812_SmicGene40390 [Symbiodinium microadriaticum]
MTLGIEAEEHSEDEPVRKCPAAKAQSKVKKAAPAKTTATKWAPKPKIKAEVAEVEAPPKRAKRSTFAGRRCPEGDIPKAGFLSMMETFAAMIAPKLVSPSQFEDAAVAFLGSEMNFLAARGFYRQVRAPVGLPGNCVRILRANFKRIYPTRFVKALLRLLPEACVQRSEFQVDMETPLVDLLLQAEWSSWDDAALVEPLRLF